MVAPNLSNFLVLYRPSGPTGTRDLLVTAPSRSESFQLFAHQGGWDEVLLVAIPLIFIAGLLWLANRRVNAQLSEAIRNDETADTSETGAGDLDS